MEYMRSNNRPAYVKEMVGLSFSIGKMIKDPKARIRNIAYAMPAFIVFECVMTAYTVFMAFRFTNKHSILIAVLIGILCVLILFYGLFILGYFLRYGSAKKLKAEDYYFDCEKEGITHHGPSMKLTVFWDQISCVRAFRYSIVFVPKDLKTRTIIAPVENLENITKFLSENNIEIPVIKD